MDFPRAAWNLVIQAIRTGRVESPLALIAAALEVSRYLVALLGPEDRPLIGTAEGGVMGREEVCEQLEQIEAAQLPEPGTVHALPPVTVLLVIEVLGHVLRIIRGH